MVHPISITASTNSLPRHGIIQDPPLDARRRRRSITSSAGHSKSGSPGPSGAASVHPSIVTPSMRGVTSSSGSVSAVSMMDADMAQTYPSLSSWNAPYSYSGSSETGGYSQDYSFEGNATEPSPMYSSDGWNSPGPENKQFQLQSQPYISTYSKPTVSYASDLQIHPTSAPIAAAGVWTTSEGYLPSDEGLGIEFTSQNLSPVGIFKTTLLNIVPIANRMLQPRHQQYFHQTWAPSFQQAIPRNQHPGVKLERDLW